MRQAAAVAVFPLWQRAAVDPRLQQPELQVFFLNSLSQGKEHCYVIKPPVCC